MPDITYIKLFVDYLDAIEPLGDAERGRLFTALLEYTRTGAAPQLGGNERFLFPMMKAQIDRDIAAFIEEQENTSRARQDAGRKGGLAKANKAKQNLANVAKPSKSWQNLANVAKEKEEDKDKDKDTFPPESPQGEAPLSADAKSTGFDPALQEAFEQWLGYKRERREGYKPTGLRNLVAQIRNAAGEFGSGAVVSLIQQCMASGYKGIMFDRLKGQRQKDKKSSGRQAEKSYDIGELEQLSHLRLPDEL